MYFSNNNWIHECDPLSYSCPLHFMFNLLVSSDTLSSLSSCWRWNFLFSIHPRNKLMASWRSIDNTALAAALIIPSHIHHSLNFTMPIFLSWESLFGYFFMKLKGGETEWLFHIKSYQPELSGSLDLNWLLDYSSLSTTMWHQNREVFGWSECTLGRLQEKIHM